MLKDKLQPFLDKYEEISSLLASPDIVSDIKKMTKLSREQSSLEPIIEKAKEYIDLIDSIEENKSLLSDKELGELAKEELKELEPQISVIEEDIKFLMLPTDENDNRNIYLEIRAGAGGDESALFAEDLIKAYMRYADIVGWKYELVNSNEGTAGGFKEIVIIIKGENVFSKLKFEGGVHRVQRVPQTESQGRVHTSAVSVAIMPEVDDVEIVINDKELKIDVMRSSGCGGQSVNTTDSAVRITHLPSGIVVTNQDQKSQHKNKDKAMKVLKAKLYELEMKKKEEEEGSARKLQVGRGDRSEKIRTYNYPQNRMTDHRIGLTLYKLDAVMQGDMQELIDALLAFDKSEKLAEAGL